MLKRLLQFALLFPALAICSSILEAQSRSDDWEIGKVFVPEDNPEIFNAFIPRDFWPIELKELNEKLELHQQQMLKQELNPAVLDLAMYVATVNRELILSDNSYWKFSGFSSNGLVRVGHVSFALRDAKGNRAEQPQLSSVNRFDTEGLIEVESNNLDNPLWFGFQLAPEVEENRRLFSFEIPRAKLGSMLISADSNLVLTSEQVVVEPISNPKEVLGDRWPPSLEPRLQPRQTWWHVHLSGVTRFDLAISESVVDRGHSFHHAISSCTINHQIGPDSITSNATFQLASESGGLPIQLKLDPSQRVRSLTVDGKVATWKAVIAEEKSHYVQLSSVNLSKGSRIEIQTVAKRETLQDTAVKLPNDKANQPVRQQTIALPGIEIANSFVLSGITNVSTDNSIELVQVLPDSGLRTVGSTHVHFGVVGEKWQLHWSRQPGRDQAIVADREERWMANSLCRLAIQTSTISATVNTVLTGSNLRSNEVRIPILKGWSVDRIRFPFDVSGKVRSGIVSSQAGDEIVLGWQGRPDNFEVYMEVTASNYLPGQTETLTIENPRILSLPQASSPMYYLIEDSSRFRLRGSPSLLSMSVSKRDLSSWQQQLLSENDTTLYRDLSNAQDKFVFDAYGDRASLSFASIFEIASNGSYRLNTILSVVPANGNLDRIQLSLPSNEKLSDWSFEFSGNSDAGIRLEPKELRTEPSADVLVELPLPMAASSPFHVIASRIWTATDTNRSESLAIPMISANDFALVDSVILLPSGLANFSNSEELELLPSVGCCNADMMDLINKIRDKRSTLLIDSWITARLEGNQSRYLNLKTTRADRNENWIWNQSLRHVVTSSGQIRHSLSIDLQPSGNQPLKIGIPTDWSLLSVTINGLASNQYSNDNGVLEFLNLGPQRNSLEAVFESPMNVLSWYSQFGLDRPEYDVPVLQSSETLSIPPAYAVMSTSVFSESPLSSSVSLWPANWWNLFDPDKDTASVKSGVHWSWVDVAPGSEGETPKFHVMHKATLASLSAVFLLILSIAAWILLHRWVRFWWWSCIVAGCCVTLSSGLATAIAQIVLLALLLGAFARMVAFVARKPKSMLKRSPLSGARATLTGLFIICFVTQNCQAQSSDIDLKQSKVDEKRIFGVIIPFNGSVDSPGEYAYIPKELRDLLPGSTTAPTPKLIEPKIVSASLVMKLRQDPRDVSPVHEFNVEMKLQIYDSNSSILLPFNLEVLRPTSLILNGQPRLLGVRYFEEAEDRSGIIFRPDSTGAVTISIQFQPTVAESPDRKYKFSTPIPAVPNAVLRIVPNALTTGLVTNASGGFQRTLSGDISANLGPISELEVEWSESDRVAQAIAAEYGSETWVRDFGDGLCVASQIILDRGRSTQDEFDLFVDSDWEPVGSKWGSADLISSTVVPALKRRVIRIRLDESAGSLITIRMLLAQRSQIRLTTLEVPFLMIDRLALKGKYFWWSTDKDADWIPEGIESLPVRTSRDDWGDLKLATDRTGYQIIGSSIKLRQQASSQLSNTQVESSTLRVYSSHTELDFDASWERMTLQSDDISVQLPPFSTVRKVEINNKSITPSQLNSNRLTIPANLTNQLANRIRVSVELPPMQGVVEGLPRILIESSQPRQSSYIVYRGADLQLKFLPTDSGLVFTSATTATRRANLENMEVFVGEANLPTEMLGDGRLSAQLEIRRATTSDQSAFTIQLSRQASGWRATARCEWNDPATQVDYAVFEVPATLRDSIDAAPLTSIFKPHRDNSRTTLCIPVPAPANQINKRIVEFSFPIASLSSTQSFVLPSIIAHHGTPATPTVVLPNKVDGRAISWMTAGSTVNAKWFEEAGVQPQDEFQYLTFMASQNKLSWQFSESKRQQARVDLIWMDLTSSTRGKVAGIMNYWITPRSQVTQIFEIPTNCEVLGVECGTRRTNWSIEQNQLRVTLQPNSVPIVIRVMAQWKLASSDRSLINYPKPLNAELPERFFLSKSSTGTWSPTDKPLDSELHQQAIVDQWASIVAETMDSLSSMPKASALNWLKSWRPQSLSITLDKPIGSTVSSSILSTVDINDDSQITVAELWQHAEEFGQSDSIVDLDLKTNKTGLMSIAQVKWSIVGDGLEITRESAVIQYRSPNYFAAIAVVVLGVTGAFVAPRSKNLVLSLLAAQPWIYWMLLALILAWILPITWPSVFVALVALWMAASQFIENHRRTRRFGF